MDGCTQMVTGPRLGLWASWGTGNCLHCTGIQLHARGDFHRLGHQGKAMTCLHTTGQMLVDTVGLGGLGFMDYHHRFLA